MAPSLGDPPGTTRRRARHCGLPTREKGRTTIVSDIPLAAHFNPSESASFGLCDLVSPAVHGDSIFARSAPSLLPPFHHCAADPPAAPWHRRCNGDGMLAQRWITSTAHRAHLSLRLPSALDAFAAFFSLAAASSRSQRGQSHSKPYSRSSRRRRRTGRLMST